MKGLISDFELATGGRVPPEQVEQVLGELESMNNLFLNPLFLLPSQLLPLTRACLILKILRVLELTEVQRNAYGLNRSRYVACY